MPTAQPKGKGPASSSPTNQATASSSTSNNNAPSPAPLTSFQVKAIKALRGIKSRDRKPKLSEWKLPTSDDPDVELLVFPLLTFEGYMKGDSPEAEDQADEGAKKDREQTRAAAASTGPTEASQHKVKQDKGKCASSSKPQPAGERREMKKPAVGSPRKDEHLGAVGKAEQDDEGTSARQDALKGQLWSIINSSPWPPQWDELEAQIRLLDFSLILDILADAKEQAEREGKAVMDCFPDLMWGLRLIHTVESTLKMYKDAPRSATCSKYAARLMAEQVQKVFVRDVMPDLEVAAEEKRRARASGGGGGGEGSGGGGGAQKNSSKGKKGGKGRKK